MGTDGQTDITKLRAAFRNFANEPKNGCTTVLPNAFNDYVHLQGV